MSANKHTPGPWRVDGNGIHAIVRGEDATIVAVRHRHGGTIHEANAHLIAAAPEMLEALEAMLWAFDASFSEPCVRARAAIKKARGES